MLNKYLDNTKYEYIKNINNLVFKALELVVYLFKDDVDKGGIPYIVHLTSVYSNVYNENQKVIALLHDTIEDKNVNDEDLIDIGFPEKIVKDVLILSKPKQLTYDEYIDNLVNNASVDALIVKLADLSNNMDLSRIKNPTQNDYDRIDNKYKLAKEKILNKLEGIGYQYDRYTL